MKIAKCYELRFRGIKNYVHLSVTPSIVHKPTCYIQENLGDKYFIDITVSNGFLVPKVKCLSTNVNVDVLYFNVI